jgi:hypothetical protein
MIHSLPIKEEALCAVKARTSTRFSATDPLRIGFPDATPFATSGRSSTKP